MSDANDMTDAGSSNAASVWLEIGQARTYEEGETLYYQGDPFDTLTYILSGNAKLVCFTENGDAFWLGHVQAGQFLGDAAFFSESEQIYEVTAASQMRVVTISKAQLTSALSRHPQLYKEIAKGLAQKFQTMAVQFTDAQVLSVRGRICAELARLAVPKGIDPTEHVIRPVPMFTKLAAQLGTTRETISRTVSSLQQEGILDRAPGAIIVVQMNALKASIV